MRQPSKAKAGVKMAIVWMVGLCMVLFAIPTFAAPSDQQCPTAAVQEITVPIYSHCGCKIGTIKRAPKQGEAGFKKCQCQTNRAVKAHSSQTRPTLFFPPVAEVLSFSIPLPQGKTRAFVAKETRLAEAPQIPPPNRA